MITIKIVNSKSKIFFLGMFIASQLIIVLALFYNMYLLLNK